MKFLSHRVALSTIILSTLGLAAPLYAYGSLGHEIVGAIAGERLANTVTATKIRALLDGLSLEKAGMMPDEIKGWDKNGVDDPKSFHYARYPKVDKQLLNFWRANPTTRDLNPGAPSHHWFHYADVPVVPVQKYAESRVGRSKWDIVHMIPYCVQVLQGRVSEQNERKITKPVAIILLAHYVADIHQPLHIGAAYSDQQGNPTDPDKNKSALADEGGNTFTLELSDEPRRTRGIYEKTFHDFWDYDAVNALFQELPQRLKKNKLEAQIEPLKKRLVHQMATHEPQNWRVPANIDIRNYAEAWADEILPIAREAHERVQFRHVHQEQEQDRVVAAGGADEKPQPGQVSYREWAANVVREELHKAGWRLADLLAKVP